MLFFEANIMFKKLGIFGDVLVGRVTNINQIKQGRYGPYGSIQVVVDVIKSQKNPLYGQTNQPEFIKNKSSEFYFLDIKGIKKVIQQLGVGDIVIVNFQVGQFTKENETFPRVQLEAKELLYHVRKIELQCLVANHLIPTPTHKPNNQNGNGQRQPNNQNGNGQRQPNNQNMTNNNWGQQPA